MCFITARKKKKEREKFSVPNVTAEQGHMIHFEIGDGLLLSTAAKSRGGPLSCVVWMNKTRDHDQSLRLENLDVVIDEATEAFQYLKGFGGFDKFQIWYTTAPSTPSSKIQLLHCTVAHVS